MNFYRGMLETTLLVVIGLACSDVGGTNSALTYAKSTRDRELIRFYGPDRRLSGNLAVGLHSIDQAEWKDESDKAKEETLAAARKTKKGLFRRLHQLIRNSALKTPEPADYMPDWNVPSPTSVVLKEVASPRPENKKEAPSTADDQPEAYESKSQSSDPPPEEKPKPKSGSGSSMTGFLSDFEKAAEQDSHFPDWMVACIIMVAALSSLCCLCTCFCLMRLRSIAERRRRDNEEHSVRVLERLLDRDVDQKELAPSVMASTSGA